ncbi:anti-sigma factor family protein [Streptomyces sp. NBC_00667]|uniref:anti-sigma factor family protein n=1 Tax=unclassified Streptomyces TaxID=2593676 RepID=UPI003FA7855F
MSGARPSPAEQHLGDRLAALVDGELSHDARERVLAHLATCPKCKAEADAQRRLKTMFVESAPPPLSAGLLARLQGLPGGDPAGPSSGAPGGGAPTAAFGYVAPAAPREALRIHEVGRAHEPGRPRRRFAFVAAGAVSLAALALGGALPLDSVEPGGSRGEAPAARPEPYLPLTDAVVRDRLPSPGVLPTFAPRGVLSPSAPVSARPVVSLAH